MPVFDYTCSSCGKAYDVYHKTREVVEDVVCPSCGSKEHKKLFSTAMVSMGGTSASTSSSAPPCEMGGGCCGGACGLN
ncbi:MAG TPA: FmdB family zinc ribbon protein [Bacteroidota bacterium]|nr:FmdB family zinc ribbon protein [Bacteroidota bacterium]